MAIPLKTKFRKKGPKTLEDRASVVATNIWRIAQEAVRHMEKEGYPLGGDRQVTSVITEIIAFLVQCADRIVYGQLNEEERGRFINALGKHLARITSVNLEEFVGPGAYAGDFINTLNARFADYSETRVQRPPTELQRAALPGRKGFPGHGGHGQQMGAGAGGGRGDA